MPEYSDSNRSNYFGRTSKPKKPSLLAQSRYNPRYDEPYDPRTRHNSRRTKPRPKIDLERHPTLKTYDQIAGEEAELILESNQPENLVAFNYLNAGENALYDLENLTREEKLELTEDAQDDLIGQEKLRLQTPDGVRIDANQPMQIRGTTSGSTTTVGGVVSSLLGKDLKNLTTTELAQFDKNYYTRTRQGLPPIINRRKGKAKQGVPQIHLEEVGGKQIIKPAAARTPIQ